MRVRADRRSREVLPAPEAEQAAAMAVLAVAGAEVDAALGLATIERNRAYILSGCLSVHAWAARHGYGPQQTGRLVELGRTLLIVPELESMVRDGRVPAESAIWVGRVLTETTMQLTSEQRQAWIQRAAATEPRQFRREAERAIEQARQGQPTIGMRFLVTLETRDGFQRARRIMSLGKRRMLTEGETLGGLVRDWLARHFDRAPERRSATTQGQPGRWVPPQVEFALRRRSDGWCEICGVRRACEKIHLETPHAHGGSREIDNIALACRECHFFFDAELLEFLHFDEEGQPHWRFDYEELTRLLNPGDRVSERPPPYRAPSPEAVPWRVRDRRHGEPCSARRGGLSPSSRRRRRRTAPT